MRPELTAPLRRKRSPNVGDGNGAAVRCARQRQAGCLSRLQPQRLQMDRRNPATHQPKRWTAGLQAIACRQTRKVCPQPRKVLKARERNAGAAASAADGLAKLRRTKPTRDRLIRNRAIQDRSIRRRWRLPGLTVRNHGHPAARHRAKPGADATMALHLEGRIQGDPLPGTASCVRGSHERVVPSVGRQQARDRRIGRFMRRSILVPTIAVC